MYVYSIYFLVYYMFSICYHLQFWSLVCNVFIIIFFFTILLSEMRSTQEVALFPGPRPASRRLQYGTASDKKLGEAWE